MIFATITAIAVACAVVVGALALHTMYTINAMREREDKENANR